MGDPSLCRHKHRHVSDPWLRLKSLDSSFTCKACLITRGSKSRSFNHEPVNYTMSTRGDVEELLAIKQRKRKERQMRMYRRLDTIIPAIILAFML